MVKEKSKRIFLTIKSEQAKMLENMMNESHIDNAMIFFSILIAEEYKRREEAKTRRPVGRPRKDDEEEEEEEEDHDKKYADDLPKNILHYGQMIGQREYDDIANLSSKFSPGN